MEKPVNGQRISGYPPVTTCIKWASVAEWLKGEMQNNHSMNAVWKFVCPIAEHCFEYGMRTRILRWSATKVLFSRARPAMRFGRNSPVLNALQVNPQTAAGTVRLQTANIPRRRVDYAGKAISESK